MMLELLETGKALYALVAVCVLGILSRLVARNLYKRLIRETDNMTLTKNRYLRDLKQKTENAYRLNQGIHNTKVYLEKQLAGYRFLGLSLNGWGNLSGQLTVLCFLLGGAAAFGAYWYRCDSYFVVLYGSVGVLAGLLTLFMDYGVNLGERKSQLLNALQDYMENSLFHRLARETASAVEGNVREVSREVRGNDRGIRNQSVRDVTIRESVSREPQNLEVRGVNREAQSMEARSASREPQNMETRNLGRREAMAGKFGMQESENRSVDARDGGGRRFGFRERDSMDSDDETAVRQWRGRLSPRLARKSDYAGEHGSESTAPIRDVDYLRRSLEQIAASREKNAGEGDWIKDLSPKELELVGEILKQYLT